MPNTIHAFDYLAKPPSEVPPIVVLFGNESFLKRLATVQLRSSVQAGADEPFTTFDGGSVEWRDVYDELSTMSLFGGGRRLAIVEAADPFVTRERARLEEYVEKPRASGVLVLVVDTWASNTRLYKAIDKSGLQVECRPPETTVGKRKVLDENRLGKWLVMRALNNDHRAKLD